MRRPGYGRTVWGGVLALLLISYGVVIAGTGFTPVAGWPIQLAGSSPDGPLVVNLDADPELEIVRIVGSASGGCQVVAYDLDGTILPGWPRFLGYGPFAPPAFGDLNGDAVGEIVVHSTFFSANGEIWAFDTAGSSLPGYPVVGVGGPVKGPSLGDVDGDGDLEVISMLNVGGIGQVLVLDEFGEALPGWPQTLDSIGGAAPSVGDLDGDGVVEIAAVSFYQLYVFNADGSLRSGFPYVPGGSQTFNYTSPVLVNLDGSGAREIVVGTSSETDFTGQMHVLNADGTVRLGWPQSTTANIFVPASIADIDGDGSLDVAVGDVLLSPVPVNQIYAWDASGAPLPGFPSGPIDGVHSQVMIADIDGDAQVELIFDSNVATSGLQAINHDGTPVDGWPLSVVGSSFQQTPVIGDFDQDGFIDLAGGGNLIAIEDTSLHLWTSSYSWNPELAPLRTYQYDPQRSGVADPEVISAPGLFLRGDANSSGDFDISDAIFMLSALFTPEASAPSCRDAADANDDGSFDISDAIFTLGSLFDPGASPPPAPGSAACGEDPTGDDLDCEDSGTACP